MNGLIVYYKLFEIKQCITSGLGPPKQIGLDAFVPFDPT